MHLCYKGTNYNGWQVQPGKPSIQGTIQDSLKVILKETTEITGCGRTDSGVHARNYYAHFDSEILKTKTPEKIVYKLNCLLPPDIKIYGIYPANENVHARFDATLRHYKYYISQQKEVFNSEFVWQLNKNLDFESMNKAAAMLLNYSDFTSFSKLHTDVKTNNCKVTHAFWSYENEFIVFSIAADRFLRNMVRAIVGTLIDVGKNKMSIDDFCTIIEHKNRAEAGGSVPASGLFLENVVYPYPIVTK